MNLDEYDKPVILEPATKAVYTIIWLHGLGADGNDFVDIVPMLGLTAQAVKFIFPHAKRQPVTINGGLTMRAWYDIKEQSIVSKPDAAGINKSVEYLKALIENEKENGISYKNIILAGFSQGGAIALQTGLNFSAALGGIIGLSTYVPLKDKVTNKSGATPIFMAHGLYDQVIPINSGRESCKFLEKLEYKISFKEYPMQHAVCPEEISDLSYFIKDRFSL